MQILKYFTEWIIFFGQNQCIAVMIFLNWYKTHFSWMLKQNNKLFCKKKSLVCLRCPIEQSKTFFWQNVLYFFSASMKNYFESIQYFYANDTLILLQKCSFYCKAPLNLHAFFILPKKSFSVFNIIALKAPSHTLKVFFLQNIL